MRKPVIGVMGGSKASASVYGMAKELGTLIAQRGWVLLNGGRNQGVMAASAEGAKQAGCDAFVTKPCLPDDLVVEVRRMLSIVKQG